MMIEQHIEQIAFDQLFLWPVWYTALWDTKKWQEWTRGRGCLHFVCVEHPSAVHVMHSRQPEGWLPIACCLHCVCKFSSKSKGILVLTALVS